MEDLSFHMEKIYVEEDFSRLYRLLAEEREYFVVMDANVSPHFSFPSDRALEISASEDEKTLAAVEGILRFMLEREAGRDAFLLGVGGGVTTDLAGLAAAIYKRGIRYALVPTTLLAQADAAIGGKTGANVCGYKNVAGTFSEPEFVYSVPGVLSTLPAREMLSGAGEILKTFIIGSAALFDEAVGLFSHCRTYGLMDAGERETLKRLISGAMELKVSITQKDRLEVSERRKLNLGHTFGHALETFCLTGGSPAYGNGCGIGRRAGEAVSGGITHGAAVAAGIMIAARISERLGCLAAAESERLVGGLVAAGFTPPDKNIVPQLVKAVRNDKKRKEDFINFVLIRRIGSVFVEKIPVGVLESLADDLY